MMRGAARGYGVPVCAKFLLCMFFLLALRMLPVAVPVTASAGGDSGPDGVRRPAAGRPSRRRLAV